MGKHGKNNVELSDVVLRFGKELMEQGALSPRQVRALNNIVSCRTVNMGGHQQIRERCGTVEYSYNGCSDRHCPKCQASKQPYWVEKLMKATLPVKHYHIIVPHELNRLYLWNHALYCDALFSAVKRTLHSFDCTHYGCETGAVAVLHTWDQNLWLHPHIHCLVPAAGLDLHGKLKRVGKNGRYLYPVGQLSSAFRTSLLKRVKADLKKANLLDPHRPTLEKAWAKEWVVHCEPALGRAERVIRYLGQYIHRVAISNQRILSIDDRNVTFQYKDYADSGKSKVMVLSGVEFLRRFCLHTLPKRFVKIRRYGIYGNRYKRQMRRACGADDSLPPETRKERLQRVLEFDPLQCPYCKKGQMVRVDVLPRIRSPGATSFPLLEKVLA